MEEEKLKICVNELKKPSEDRNIEKVLDYLKKLDSFMNLIQGKGKAYEEILLKSSIIMKYKKSAKNDIIFQYGDRGDDFYIILKGIVGIFVPKFQEYYMNEEEYILHLLTLKKYNQDELIYNCLEKNAVFYSIPYDNFDEFLYDLTIEKTRGGVFLDKINIIKKAKEVLEYTKTEEFNKIKSNISPEKFILQIEVSNSVKENNNKQAGKSLNTNGKKLIKIPKFIKVNQLKTGDTFGELALDSSNCKRTASILTSQNCDFAVINRNEYKELIKDSVAKCRNNFFELIYTYKIFDNVNRSLFEKNYYNQFRYYKVNRNSFILNEGEECKDVYFILNGEYEIFLNRNIYEVNQIIEYLKKRLDELNKIIKEIKSKNTENNYLEKKYVSSNSDKKIEFEENNGILDDNENLLKNKNSLGERFDQIIFNKKKIMLGIYKSRQILGLSDLINRNKNNNISLINCRCLSNIGELYKINYSKFLNMYQNEKNVQLFTSELLVQSIHLIIKRLILHKNFVYKNIKDEEFYMRKTFSKNFDSKNKKITSSNNIKLSSVEKYILLSKKFNGTFSTNIYNSYIKENTFSNKNKINKRKIAISSFPRNLKKDFSNQKVKIIYNGNIDNSEKKSKYKDLRLVGGQWPSIANNTIKIQRNKSLYDNYLTKNNEINQNSPYRDRISSCIEEFPSVRKPINKFENSPGNKVTISQDKGISKSEKKKLFPFINKKNEKKTKKYKNNTKSKKDNRNSHKPKDIDIFSTSKDNESSSIDYFSYNLSDLYGNNLREIKVIVNTSPWDKEQKEKERENKLSKYYLHTFNSKKKDKVYNFNNYKGVYKTYKTNSNLYKNKIKEY